MAERLDPAASFAGLTRRSPWDDLQVAYFAGEANGNYFAAPFILARGADGALRVQLRHLRKQFHARPDGAACPWRAGKPR